MWVQGTTYEMGVQIPQWEGVILMGHVPAHYNVPRKQANAFPTTKWRRSLLTNYFGYL